MTFDAQIPLTEDNFFSYCMKMYDNPSCKGLSEFHDDLKHLKYLIRLFKRYQRKGIIEPLWLRLTLNHLIILYNVFPVEAATKILFYRIDKSLWTILKTFLVYLNFIEPDMVVRPPNGKGKVVYVTDIKLDKNLITELRKI